MLVMETLKTMIQCPHGFREIIASYGKIGDLVTT